MEQIVLDLAFDEAECCEDGEDGSLKLANDVGKVVSPPPSPELTQREEATPRVPTFELCMSSDDGDAPAPQNGEDGGKTGKGGATAKTGVATAKTAGKGGATGQGGAAGKILLEARWDAARQWFEKNPWTLGSWNAIVGSAFGLTRATLTEILKDHVVDTRGNKGVLVHRVCEVILEKRATIAKADEAKGLETEFTKLAREDPGTMDSFKKMMSSK